MDLRNDKAFNEYLNDEWLKLKKNIKTQLLLMLEIITPEFYNENIYDLNEPKEREIDSLPYEYELILFQLVREAIWEKIKDKSQQLKLEYKALGLLNMILDKDEFFEQQYKLFNI